MAGFTLLELMIVVVIVAILASIAVASYAKYAKKARRSDAVSALSMDQSILENCYATTFDYSQVSSATSGCQVLSASAPNPSPKGYYDVTLALPPPTTSAAVAVSYTLTAVSVAGSPQANDSQCAKFVVTSASGHSALDSSGSDQTDTCWQH